MQEKAVDSGSCGDYGGVVDVSLPYQGMHSEGQGQSISSIHRWGSLSNFAAD